MPASASEPLRPLVSAERGISAPCELQRFLFPRKEAGEAASFAPRNALSMCKPERASKLVFSKRKTGPAVSSLWHSNRGSQRIPLA